ncbi:MAG TPA: two-component regulator propeller domain-containing protein [Anaerolineales bacterium]|nr:two-component regulator propeller domain-containing protein [Anaerolineales bacterium]
MQDKLYWLLALLALLALACSAVVPTAPRSAQNTPFVVTEAAQPPVSQAAQSTPSPAAPPPPETVPTGFLLQPSNRADLWPLYDSPSAVTVLLWDGQFMWAGSQGGGLVQWDPQTLAAVRHTQATGFPLLTVNDLAFDPAGGLLYAAGDAGLAIWDGTQWRHMLPKQMGFVYDAPLRCVLVEDGTTLWVGQDQAMDMGGFGDEIMASGGGLARGDWQANTWQHYEAPDALLSNQVNDLALDANGTLWVATGIYGNEPTSGGVSYREAAGKWAHYGLDHGADGFQNDRGLDGYAFGTLALGPDGTIYAAGRRGVSWLAPGAGQWQSAAAWDARQMAFDPQGMLWVAGREGLFVLAVDSLSPIFSQSQYDHYQGLAFDGQNEAWFGGENGLFEMVEGQAESRQVPGALPARWVTDAAVNADGSLWLRTGETISRINGQRIEYFADQRQAIQAAYPWTGRQTLWPTAPDGSLWIVESGGFAGYNGVWQTVPLDPALEGGVGSFVVGPDGLIVAANPAGISQYTPAQGWRYTPVPERVVYLGNLVFDPQRQAVWGSTAYSNFFPGQALRFDLGTQAWTLVEEGIIAGVPPQGIALAPNGDIWVAGTSGHLAIYRPDGSWHKLNAPDGLLGEAAGFGEIYFAPDGSTWLTTLKLCGFEAICVDGLVRYSGDAWQQFTTTNSGLADNWVSEIAFDPSGSLWLATSAGLQHMPALPHPPALHHPPAP